MEFHFTSKLEEYYQKFVDLQEKLKKSEEERFILETKFNDMVQVAKEEEQAHYRKLRSQYKRFLEEDKKRQDRNERIIRNLERIETRISMLSAKTDRINLLRRQYQNFLLRIANPNRERKLPDSGISRERSFIREEPLKKQQGPLFRDDFSLPTNNINLKQPLFEHPTSFEKNHHQSNEEKIEILDRYLQSISTQRCRDLINQEKTCTRSNPFCKDDCAPSGNHATAIADDIMNSIYSRYYNKVDENLGNHGTEPTVEDLEHARNMKAFESKFGALDKTCDNESMGEHEDKNETKPSVYLNEKIDVTVTEDKDYKSIEIVMNAKDQISNETTNTQHKSENIVNEAETIKPKPSAIIIPNDSFNIQQAIIDPIDSSSTENVILISNENPQPQYEDTIAAEEMYQHPDNEETTQLQANISEVYQQPDQPLDNQDMSPEVTHQTLLANQTQEVYDQSQEKAHFDQSEEEQEVQYEQSVPISQIIQPLNNAEIENKEHQQETPSPNDQAQVPQKHSVENEHIENKASIDDQQNELNQEYNPQTQFDPTQYVDENGQPLQYDPSYDQQQFDENGQPIHYDPASGYDQYGQPILYDQHGQIVQPQYEENGLIIPQYDENGQLIILYDQSGNVYGQNEQQQYDPNGEVYEQYDQNVQYDENGQPIYDPSYNYEADPNQQGYEADSNQQGYEVDPNQQGYEVDPNQQKYEADPNQQKYDDHYRAVDDQGFAAVKDDQIVDEGKNDNKDEGEREIKDEIGNDDKDDGQEKHEILETKDKNDVEKVAKVMDILDTDTESTKQNTSKISNDTDFDFS
ncbi:unnamed protein product [Ceutorhynchus assimilis]|uniref:Uncharacterized protein n=1 Tax=Ceutorhynchus assimilis TaxID=467358 RepID=A0A9N9MVW9_9CUCU|nr:unnamed protein product [Ceutorhynchus assimilis]